MTTTTETDVKYPGRPVRNTRTGEAGRVTGYDLDTLSVEYDERPGQDSAGPAGDFEVIGEGATQSPEDAADADRIIERMKAFIGPDEEL